MRPDMFFEDAGGDNCEPVALLDRNGVEKPNASLGFELIT